MDATLTYSQVKTRSWDPEKGKYVCALCADEKLFSGQGFGSHIKKIHGIISDGAVVNKGKVKKSKVAMPVSSESTLKFCPNCGCNIAELSIAMNLLKGKP